MVCMVGDGMIHPNEKIIMDDDMPEAVIRYTVNSHTVDFVVYEIFGYIDHPGGPGFRYIDPTSVCNTDTKLTEPPEDRGETQWIDGTLKWDGCVNLSFSDTCWHFCGPDTSMARTFAAIYELGPLMKTWDRT